MFSSTKRTTFDANTVDWKSWITASVIGASAALTIYMGSKFIVKPHDNIPMIAKDDFGYFGGHMSICKTWGDIHLWHTWLFSQMKKVSWHPVVSLSLPGAQFIFVNDPKILRFLLEQNAETVVKSDKFRGEFRILLGDGIFNSNGETWKFHRKVASRMFSMRNLKDFMYDMSAKHTHKTITKLHALTAKMKEIDINDILGRFTLDTFSDIAFGVSIDSVSSYPNIHEFGVAFDDLVYRIDMRSMNPLWKLERVFQTSENERHCTKDSNIINNFVNDILDQKFIGSKRTNSAMKDEHGSEVKGNMSLLSLFLEHDPNLNRNDLRDIAMNFIIAGRDTTRMLLSWFVYELCKYENRNVLSKLYKEIDEFKQNGKQPKYSDFSQGAGLRYLEGALCETLRLHPPVPIIGRSCSKDLELPEINGKKYIIRKGNYVLSSQWSLGRCTKLWGDDAMVFNPDRWKEKGLNTFDQYKFAVFNVMPRLCLGKTFAITEAKVFAFHLLENFTFSRIENKEVIIRSGAILNMDSGLFVNLEPRH